MNKLEINGTQYDIQELTVGKIRELLRGDELRSEEAKTSKNDFRAKYDPLGEELIVDVSFRTLSQLSGIPLKEFDSFRPSDLQLLNKECRRVNPDFFVMSDKRAAHVEKMMNSPEGRVALAQAITDASSTGSAAK